MRAKASPVTANSALIASYLARARRSARRRGGRRRWRLVPGSSDRCRLEPGDDLLAVGAEDLLLAVRHEVDVEVVDADRLELTQLVAHLVDRADDGEAVADLVGDKLPVRRALAAVLLVVVELPRLHVLRQLLWDLRVLAVALDQVHDVVGDHRREPADGVTGLLHVVGDDTRRADVALELVGVAPGLGGRVARLLHDP